MQHQKHGALAKRIELYPLLPHKGIGPGRLAIPTHDRVVIILVQDILYLKSDSNYTHIFLKNRDAIIASYTLKRFEEFLPSTDFMRLHQSYIISASSMIEYHPGLGEVILQNGSIIPVSRSRKQLISGYLKSLMI